MKQTVPEHVDLNVLDAGFWKSRREHRVKLEDLMEEDAIDGLMALGERRADAEHLLERVKSGGVELKTTDALLREMLRLRTVRG